MYRRYVLIIDAFVYVTVLTFGVSLAWLGDYRGRTIIRQNQEIARLLKELLNNPYLKSEKMHGAGPDHPNH